MPIITQVGNLFGHLKSLSGGAWYLDFGASFVSWNAVAQLGNDIIAVGSYSGTRVMRINSAGVVVWQKHVASWASPDGVFVTAAGNICVYGTHGGLACILMLNGTGAKVREATYGTGAVAGLVELGGVLHAAVKTTFPDGAILALASDLSVTAQVGTDDVSFVSGGHDVLATDGADLYVCDYSAGNLAKISGDLTTIDASTRYTQWDRLVCDGTDLYALGVNSTGSGRDAVFSKMSSSFSVAWTQGFGNGSTSVNAAGIAVTGGRVYASAANASGGAGWLKVYTTAGALEFSRTIEWLGGREGVAGSIAVIGEFMYLCPSSSSPILKLPIDGSLTGVNHDLTYTAAGPSSASIGAASASTAALSVTALSASDPNLTVSTGTLSSIQKDLP